MRDLVAIFCCAWSRGDLLSPASGAGTESPIPQSIHKALTVERHLQLAEPHAFISVQGLPGLHDGKRSAF